MAAEEIELSQAEAGAKGDPLKAGHYVKFLKHNGEFQALQNLFPGAILKSLDAAVVGLIRGANITYKGQRYRIVIEAAPPKKV